MKRAKTENPGIYGIFSAFQDNLNRCDIGNWRAGDEETENYTYAIALQNDT